MEILSEVNISVSPVGLEERSRKEYTMAPDTRVPDTMIAAPKCMANVVSRGIQLLKMDFLAASVPAATLGRTCAALMAGDESSDNSLDDFRSIWVSSGLCSIVNGNLRIHGSSSLPRGSPH